MKALDDLSFDDYHAMKIEGVSVEDASSYAYKQGMTIIVITRMLRDVYDLSFDQATRLLAKYQS